MKSGILRFTTLMVLFAVPAVPVQLAAQAKYRIVNLGTWGGTAGGAASINNRGWATGNANPQGDQTTIATLWFNGSKTKLGTLGGPNSAVACPVKNDSGVIVGISETADINPWVSVFLAQVSSVRRGQAMSARDSDGRAT
jgi:uncharacterized membrane protein